MTMLEAIRSARIAFNKLYVSCDCEADKEYDAGADAFGDAESEAKREAEAFNNARAAFPAVIPFIGADDDGFACSAAMDVLRAYFATGEKEG